MSMSFWICLHVPNSGANHHGPVAHWAMVTALTNVDFLVGRRHLAPPKKGERLSSLRAPHQHDRTRGTTLGRIRELAQWRAIHVAYHRSGPEAVLRSHICTACSCRGCGGN